MSLLLKAMVQSNARRAEAKSKLDQLMREYTDDTQEAVDILFDQAVMYAVLTKYELATWDELRADLVKGLETRFDIAAAVAQQMEDGK